LHERIAGLIAFFISVSRCYSTLLPAGDWGVRDCSHFVRLPTLKLANFHNLR
jgi:hypothetical protein